MLIALVLIPFMWVAYTAAVAIFGVSFGLAPPWDYEAALLFFFFIPFFFYGAVRVGLYTIVPLPILYGMYCNTG